MMRHFTLLILVLFILTGCTRKEKFGSSENPIKISLVPGQDLVILDKYGKSLEKWLSQQTGLAVKINVPINFVTVVESLGSKKADMAIMNTFGYLVAHERYGAEARLIGVNNGTKDYRGQIISLKTGPKSLKELDGKKFAFVDPVSTSGYVLAAQLLKVENVKLKDFVFAGRHDSVVQMVYQGRVDAGATFYSLPVNGEPRDARHLVKKQYPDVFERVQVIAMTGSIPNDPIVFRKDFPPEVREAMIKALKDYFKTAEGQEVMYGLYHMTSVDDVRDSHWDPVRKIILDLGKSAQDFIK